MPNPKVSAREINREGSDLNLLATAATVMGEEVVNRMARAMAGAFEDTAEGAALDRVILDRKGLPRLPAAPAVVSLELTRPTNLAGAGILPGGPAGSGPPAPTRLRTNQNIVYFLLEPAVFGAADLGPITVPAQAEIAGLENEVGPNQQWSFLDTPFDQTIEVSNPDEEVAAGASDDESDDAYRSRSRDFYSTVRRGTLGAIELGVRSTPGVASGSALETLSASTGLPACHVEAYYLDALGRSNQTLGARVGLNLLTYRAAGIPVVRVDGVVQNVTINFDLFDFDTKIVVDTAQAFDDVRNAIVAALGNQRPGQNLLRSTILAAARSIPGVLVEDSDLLEPAGTLIPSSSEITFRTRKELISRSG